MDYVQYQEGDDTQRKADELRNQLLAAFASSVSDKRKEAIEARKLSGIEEAWQEDEEYYNGVDKFNNGHALRKPTTKAGRVTSRAKGKGQRSTAFINITQPYVDLVTAREFDMLFPTDDKPFGFEPTPVPEIDKLTDSKAQMPDGQMSEGDAAKAYLKAAKDMADLAETKVWDWLSESSWHTEGRKVVQQKNMVGTGVLKGPFPKSRTRTKVNKSGGLIAIEKLHEITPCTKCIDVWNLYPDPSCGNDIHNGNYIFEKDTITGKQLRMLKDGGGYLSEEIDKVLEEGPGKVYLTDDHRRRSNAAYFQEHSDTYEIWYYHGQATKKDMMAMGCECDGDIDVLVVMVNDHVIKAKKQSLESGEFPYDIFVYQGRINHWAGIGVARVVRTAQEMVNASVRAMMDNAGLTAGPQIVYRSGVIRPADGNPELTPLKTWYVDEDATIQDVRDAFVSITIPNNQQHMEAVIRLALDFAERVTSMPLILQGQQGAATDTVGGMQILQQNSNTVLRRTAKLFDDVVERHIGRYYDWLLQYGDDDKAKGDLNIIVKGSSALYERDAQNQAILQLVQFSADPGFLLSKDRLMVEILKSNKISPERVTMTEEEIKAMKEQPPPADPSMEVAKLKAESDMAREKLRQENDNKDAELKQQAMQSEMALKLQLDAQNRELQLQLAQMQRDLKILELSQSSQISVEKIKAQLADSSLKLSTQKELSYASMDKDGIDRERDKRHEKEMSPIISTPPTEPAGRAENGRAYEQ